MSLLCSVEIRAIVVTISLLVALDHVKGPHAAEDAATPLPAWMKPESQVVIAVELAHFWNGAEKASLQEISSLHPFVITWLLRDAEQLTGLKASDVARLTLSEEWPAGWVIAVETPKPADIDVLRSKLLSDVSAKPLGNHTYYENEGYALFSWRPTIALVTSQPEALKTLISRLDAQTSPDATQSKQLPGLALLDASIRPDALAEALGQGGVPAQLSPLVRASRLRARFEPSKELTFRLVADYSDEISAEAALASLKFAAEALDGYLGMCEQNMPMAVKRFATERAEAEKLGPLLDQAIKSARKGLATASVSRDGNSAMMQVSVQSSRPATDAILLLSLMPRAAK